MENMEKVFNRLTFKGEHQILANLAESIHTPKSVFSLNKLCPIPEEIPFETCEDPRNDLLDIWYGWEWDIYAPDYISNPYMGVSWDTLEDLQQKLLEKDEETKRKYAALNQEPPILELCKPLADKLYDIYYRCTEINRELFMANLWGLDEDAKDCTSRWDGQETYIVDFTTAGDTICELISISHGSTEVFSFSDPPVDIQLDWWTEDGSYSGSKLYAHQPKELPSQ